ncbi:hypothetical protein ACWDHW_06150 [Streptomyces melanosporofaciens]
MTEGEIYFLSLGVTVGVYLMLLVQVVGQMVDDRRDRRALAAATSAARAGGES